MFDKIILATGALALTACANAAADTPTPQDSAQAILDQPIMVYDPVTTPEGWAKECKPWDDWDKPAPAFRIYGDTFYVGTCGIAAIYIAHEFSNTLIDTGTQVGVESVIANIASLRPYMSGQPMVDRVIYSHEHFDHVGGHASLQNQVPQAEFYASPAAALVFRTGKDHPEDPQFGMHEPMQPVRIYKEITSGSIIGHSRIRAIETPGHTPGALTWQWESCEGDVCKTIVYADSLSPISRDGYKFSDHPEYVAKYRAGIAKLRALKCDILLTPHPSHSRMVKRAATGSFEGGMTCTEYADSKTKALDARLAKEAVGE